MKIRPTLVHAGQAIAEGSLIALLVVGLAAGTAFAAKGGGSTASSPKVVMVEDTSGNGSPNWAEKVTFTFSTTNPYPVISLTCSQGGKVVFGDSRPMYSPNIWDDPGIFTLSSASWTGGAATCTALLKGTSKGRVVTLGSSTFAAGA
jgi:hypothetical protein